MSRVRIYVELEGLYFTVKSTDEVVSTLEQLHQAPNEFVNLEGLHIRPSSILAWHVLEEDEE